MSRNAFAQCEREYNEREEAREMARAEREQVRPGPFCRNPEPLVNEIEVGIWAICCDICLAIGPHQDGEQSPQLALDKWNRK
jgi:hypothetical protein